MLRAFVATVLAALCLSGSSARSDDIPTLDVNPVCHGIAMQGELEAGLQQTSFQQCVQSEQATRDEIKKAWSRFSASDKSHCVALAKTGGESSYTELITCMEMARDVRKLHQDQQKGSDTSSAPVPVGLPARWVIVSRRQDPLGNSGHQWMRPIGLCASQLFAV